MLGAGCIKVKTTGMTKDEIKQEVIMNLINGYFEASKALANPIRGLFDFEKASEDVKYGFCCGIQSCVLAIDQSMDEPQLTELRLDRKMDS